MASPGIDARARANPDAPALSDAHGTLGWARLAAELDGVGTAMVAVAGTHRVAVTGENVAPTLVAHAAGMVSGVGTVAISRQSTAAEMAQMCSDADAVAMVTGPGALAAATGAAEQAGLLALVVHGAQPPAGALPWSAWTRTVPDLPDPATRPARPPLVFTSGTTGRARGTEVRWTSPTPPTAQAYVAALTGRASFPPGPHLVVGPLAHNGPLTALRHLLAGEPVVVLDRFDAETLLRLVAEHGVTSAVMVPTHFQRLLALPPEIRADYDVSSLVSLAHTGSACPPDVKRAMIDWFGPVLTESYGGSEVGTVCRITSPEWLERPGSVGRAADPYEVVVVGDATPAGDPRVLAPFETGILGFRAPAGRGPVYLGDAEKTAKAYLLPGVFTLGDVGHVDDEGYVYITDRIADMVLSGGVNLYPAESERVLAQHPQVAEVAVIGVPDSDLGEALHALVVPAGAEPDPAELQAFCRVSLASYKCPRTFEFVGELTRNAMGKLDKRAMRAPYWADARTIAG